MKKYFIHKWYQDNSDMVNRGFHTSMDTWGQLQKTTGILDGTHQHTKLETVITICESNGLLYIEKKWVRTIEHWRCEWQNESFQLFHSKAICSPMQYVEQGRKYKKKNTAYHFEKTFQVLSSVFYL